jgi:hypothetical protein
MGVSPNIRGYNGNKTQSDPLFRGLDMGLSNARDGRDRFGGGIER